MTKCDCINCQIKTIMKCSRGFQKMIWLSEHIYFGSAIVTQNEEEHSLVINDLACLLNL